MEPKQESFSVIKQKLIKTDELITMYIELKNKSKESEQANELLKNNYDQSQLENERYKNRLQSLLNKYEQLDKQYKESNSEREFLDERYNQYLIESQGIIKNLEDELAMIKELKTAAESLSQNDTNKFDELEQELDKHKNNYDMLLKENSSIKDQLEKTNIEKDRALDGMQKDLNQLQTRMDNNIKLHSQICRQKDQEIHDLKSSLCNMDDLKKEIANLKNENNSLIKERSKVQQKTSVSIQTDEPVSQHDESDEESLADIFKEMINFPPIALSPLRAPTPNLVLDDPPKEIPTIIVTPCTPLTETPLTENTQDFPEIKPPKIPIRKIENINPNVFKKYKIFKKTKSIKKPKPKSDDSVLRALKILKKSKINFTISNESSHQLCYRNSVCIPPHQFNAAPQMESLSCKSKGCKKTYMLLNQSGPNETLLGFFDVKNENMTPPLSRLDNRIYNEPEDPLRFLQNKVKHEITPENVLDKLAELVMEKIKNTPSTKTHIPSENSVPSFHTNFSKVDSISEHPRVYYSQNEYDPRSEDLSPNHSKNYSKVSKSEVSFPDCLQNGLVSETPKVYKTCFNTENVLPSYPRQNSYISDNCRMTKTDLNIENLLPTYASQNNLVSEASEMSGTNIKSEILLPSYPKQNSFKTEIAGTDIKSKNQLHSYPGHKILISEASNTPETDLKLNNVLTNHPRIRTLTSEASNMSGTKLKSENVLPTYASQNNLVSEASEMSETNIKSEILLPSYPKQHSFKTEIAGTDIKSNNQLPSNPSKKILISESSNTPDTNLKCYNVLTSHHRIKTLTSEASNMTGTKLKSENVLLTYASQNNSVSEASEVSETNIKSEILLPSYPKQNSFKTEIAGTDIKSNNQLPSYPSQKILISESSNTPDTNLKCNNVLTSHPRIKTSTSEASNMSETNLKSENVLPTYASQNNSVSEASEVSETNIKSEILLPSYPKQNSFKTEIAGTGIKSNNQLPSDPSKKILISESSNTPDTNLKCYNVLTSHHRIKTLTSEASNMTGTKLKSENVLLTYASQNNSVSEASKMSGTDIKSEILLPSYPKQISFKTEFAGNDLKSKYLLPSCPIQKRFISESLNIPATDLKLNNILLSYPRKNTVIFKSSNMSRTNLKIENYCPNSSTSKVTGTNIKLEHLLPSFSNPKTSISEASKMLETNLKSENPLPSYSSPNSAIFKVSRANQNSENLLSSYPYQTASISEDSKMSGTNLKSENLLLSYPVISEASKLSENDLKLENLLPRYSSPNSNVSEDSKISTTDIKLENPLPSHSYQNASTSDGSKMSRTNLKSENPVHICPVQNSLTSESFKFELKSRTLPPSYSSTNSSISKASSFTETDLKSENLLSNYPNQNPLIPKSSVISETNLKDDGSSVPGSDLNSENPLYSYPAAISEASEISGTDFKSECLLPSYPMQNGLKSEGSKVPGTDLNLENSLSSYSIAISDASKMSKTDSKSECLLPSYPMQNGLKSEGSKVPGTDLNSENPLYSYPAAISEASEISGTDFKSECLLPSYPMQNGLKSEGSKVPGTDLNLENSLSSYSTAISGASKMSKTDFKSKCILPSYPMQNGLKSEGSKVHGTDFNSENSLSSYSTAISDASKMSKTDSKSECLLPSYPMQNGLKSEGSKVPGTDLNSENSLSRYSTAISEASKMSGTGFKSENLLPSYPMQNGLKSEGSRVLGTDPNSENSLSSYPTVISETFKLSVADLKSEYPLPSNNMQNGLKSEGSTLPETDLNSGNPLSNYSLAISETFKIAETNLKSENLLPSYPSPNSNYSESLKVDESDVESEVSFSCYPDNFSQNSSASEPDLKLENLVPNFHSQNSLISEGSENEADLRSEILHNNLSRVSELAHSKDYSSDSNISSLENKVDIRSEIFHTNTVTFKQNLRSTTDKIEKTRKPNLSIKENSYNVSCDSNSSKSTVINDLVDNDDPKTHSIKPNQKINVLSLEIFKNFVKQPTTSNALQSPSKPSKNEREYSDKTLKHFQPPLLISPLSTSSNELDTNIGQSKVNRKMIYKDDAPKRRRKKANKDKTNALGVSSLASVKLISAMNQKLREVLKDGAILPKSNFESSKTINGTSDNAEEENDISKADRRLSKSIDTSDSVLDRPRRKRTKNTNLFSYTSDDEISSRTNKCRKITNDVSDSYLLDAHTKRTESYNGSDNEGMLMIDDGKKSIKRRPKNCTKEDKEIDEVPKRHKPIKRVTKLQSKVMKQMKEKQKMFQKQCTVFEDDCDSKLKESPVKVKPLVINNKKINVPANPSKQINSIKVCKNDGDILCQIIKDMDKIKPRERKKISLDKINVEDEKPRNKNDGDILRRIMNDMDKIKPREKEKCYLDKVDIPDVKDERRWRKNILDIAEVAHHSRNIDVRTIYGLKPYKKKRSGILINGAKIPQKITFLLNKLLKIPNEDDIPNSILWEFKRLTIDEIVDVIIYQVSRDFDDKPDCKQYPMPLMTKTQRIFLSLLILLEKEKGFENILDEFYFKTQQHILRMGCSIRAALPLTRLFLGLCRLHADINRMRTFCCEAFFYTGDLAIPILFTVLTSWTEVIPMEVDVKSYPLAKIMVQIIHLKASVKPGYNLFPLKCLLSQYHGYPKERWDCDKLFSEICQEYLVNPNIITDYAIRLFCKNKETQWVYKKLNEFFKPLIYKIPSEKVNFKASTIILMGKICRQFKPSDKEDEKCLLELQRWFEGLLEGDVADLVKQSTLKSLEHLPKRGKKPTDKYFESKTA